MILTAGLSPAWQQVMLFDAFTPGEVNRAREVRWCASGKVLNVARALHALAAPVTALTLTGGSPGQAIRRDFATRGIPARWIDSAVPTRVCTTLLVAGQHSATELVPEALAVADAEREALCQAYMDEAATADMAILIGSLPPGTPTDFYRTLIAGTSGRVILDARGPELLEALAARPFMVKPNRQELGRTFGRDLGSDKGLFSTMAEVNERGAEWVLVTDGPRPTYACSGGQLYRLQTPAVPVINPIGCGDCMAGGIAWSLWRGRTPLDALRYGLAVAAVKAGRLLPGDVDALPVETLASTVEVTRLA
jgi:tagatose 6-phosphate kinase